MIDFEVSKVKSDSRPNPISYDPAAFGTQFIKVMITIRWSRERGWHEAKLRPYEPFHMDPASQVFHYGQAVFEGMKAFRHGDLISLFRAEENARRMARSCERMAMPALPEEIFIRAVELLIREDRSWVSEAEEQTLYIRPFMIADQPNLGFFRRSDSFLFSIIASPTVSYFRPDADALRIFVELKQRRAVRGGTGSAKCSGNYAGTLAAIERASVFNCDQVLWLDAEEGRFIEELSTSNIFFVFGETLVTPQLNGTILDGITRKSVLQLAQDCGYEISERPVSLDECCTAARSGDLKEAFSSGTSSTIVPIGTLKIGDSEIRLGDTREGPITKVIRHTLTSIQFGRVEDVHGWMRNILS